MLLDDFWYTLKAKEEIMTDDPVGGLDVSLLQDHLLAPGPRDRGSEDR